MTDTSDLMQQAKTMQENMEHAADELSQLQIIGEAAGGMVRVTMNGKGEIVTIKIDPSLLVPAEVGILEDLLKTAIAGVKEKADKAVRLRIAEIMPNGMGLPE
ncbi:hypothetical protein MNBD_ALPHA06-1472 [hydrothermal vent metagenome]|uniref:Nucleoid-associated protein YaaK n=1 Tax=hydrothermal vent metagenome TaxID=652676 RepID=A0A3B0R0E4_9ZZZZ